MTKLINTATKALIEKWEGRELVAYADVAGLPTIGIGHYDPALVVGLTTITDDECDRLFADDGGVAGAAIENMVKVDLNENQYGALVSFVFNLGSGRLKDSTLLKFLNAGYMVSAADQFLMWDKCRIDGVLTVNTQLHERRQDERGLFLTSVDAGRA